MFRTDPASKYSVLHIVEIIPGDNDVCVMSHILLSLLSCNYIRRMCRCVLQCLGEKSIT